MTGFDYQYSEDKGVKEEPTLTPTIKTNWRDNESRDEWKTFVNSAREILHRLVVYDVLSDQTETQLAIICHYQDSEPDSIEQAYDRASATGELYAKTVDSIPYPQSLYGTIVGDTTVTLISSDKSVIQAVIDGTYSTDEFANKMNIPQCCADESCTVHDDHGHTTQYYETAVRTSEQIDNGITNDVRTFERAREVMSACHSNPGVNTFWKYLGISFLTYTPCAFDCESAIEHARTRYDVLSEYEPDNANRIAEWLEFPLEYDSLNGVGHVKNEHFIMFFTDDWWWDKRHVVLNGGINSLEWKEVV